MKKMLMVLLVLFLIFGITNQLESRSQSNPELGKRYIKLGNTYREGAEYDKAMEYLSKGIKIVKKSRDKYWTAVGYEFMGYYYEDQNMQDRAIDYYEKALAIYEDIITQPDGSPIAIRHLLLRLGGNNGRIGSAIVNLDNQKLRIIPSGLPAGINNLSIRNNKIKEINGLSAYKELEYVDLSGNKIKFVPETISDLKKLKYLNLSDNKLKNIPIAALCNLMNLKILNLSGNKIPFEQIANLIRCLPNTNIQHDLYELKKTYQPGP